MLQSIKIRLYEYVLDYLFITLFLIISTASYPLNAESHSSSALIFRQFIIIFRASILNSSSSTIRILVRSVDSIYLSWLFPLNWQYLTGRLCKSASGFQFKIRFLESAS